jgi:hypothetical protein
MGKKVRAMKTSRTFPLLVIIGALLLASLACQQAGEILTPEEATARVEASVQSNFENMENVEDAEFQTGDKVELTSPDTAVPLFSKAAGNAPFLNANSGDIAFVRESRSVDDAIWYRIEGATGNGWVAAENVKLPSEEEAVEEPTFADGETVLLQGVGFMISLYDDAGSRQIIAQQERGVEVVVLESTTVGAEIWYRIDAPTGEGWVPSSNIVAIEE